MPWPSGRHGYSPRISRARKMRWQATIKVAVRRLTPCSAATCQMPAKASCMMRTRRALISSSLQKKLEKSCTHSKELTVTPPALAITSGSTSTSLSCRMSSASGVVGPLAPSITTLALIWPALRRGVSLSTPPPNRIPPTTPHKTRPATAVAPAMGLHMGQQRRHIQALVVADGAGMVLHCHHPGAGLRKQLAGGAADIAPPPHSPPPPFHAAQGAAQVHRLARDHSGGGGAHIHRVGVHHPGHDLAIGVHIGRRDVLGRADDDADLAGVAPCQPLQLAARELSGVDADAALGAAVGHVHCRVLDRHPGGQGHHL